VTKRTPSPLPMKDDEAEALLLPHEIVRDPVQHDITITALERVIIDTLGFQRLRSINQLGPTHIVYPGAVHTRFLHSLGTLHCAEQLVHIANQKYSTHSQPSLMRVDSYSHLLIRLCALLHDAAHMPFSHTLEDEGNLADPEWEDAKRADEWLGEGKEIPTAILKFLIDSGFSSSAAEQVVSDIRHYLLFTGDPMELEYPFIVDFVGNTLCADLLDYLDRDMYFTGLRERSGDRVIKYVAVVRVIRPKNNEDGEEEFLPSDEPTKGKGRVVLLAYRFEREHLAGGQLKPVLKSEILSEAIDLLRRRFALAEKVYFHRTKLAASAMLISAMGNASLKMHEIYGLSDNALLSLLHSDANPRTQRLAKAYEARRLYKPVYRIAYREECDADPQSKILWREKYKAFRSPAWRKEKEQDIETYSGLPVGSAAIYCPDRGMNLKEFEMLVQSQPGAEIKPLGNILDSNRRLEMDAINQRFAQLWSFFVFVDPQAIDVSQVQNEAVQDLNAICESIIGFPNDIAALQGKGRPLRAQLATRMIREHEQAGGGKVEFGVYEELVRAPHRAERSSDLLDEIRNHLRALMGQKKAKQLELNTGEKGE